jgi:hypothetical protein
MQAKVFPSSLPGGRVTLHLGADLLSLRGANPAKRGYTMPRYKVAHITNEQGIDLIIIPLESRFGALSAANQSSETAALQSRATSAGLKGVVIPVWDGGRNRMAFRAPPNCHPFFRGINLHFVFAKINREIFW